MRRGAVGGVILFGLLTFWQPLTGRAVEPDAGRADFLGSFRWTDPDRRFGGLSGIELAADGAHFTVIGDRGIVFRGRLLREGTQTVGVERGPIEPLRNIAGAPLDGDWADAEGLAVTPGGRILVSFERRHRVLSYDAVGGRAMGLPRHPAFAGLGHNNGLEALAMDVAGVLWALPEAPQDGVFPLFRFEGEGWTRPHALPARGPYLAVGADFGPDGRFYLLERDFAGIARGVSSRVRAFDFGPDGPEGEEVILVTPYGDFDNLEGISVWRDGAGAIRLTLVSDDNFNPLQRTEIVEYRLRD